MDLEFRVVVGFRGCMRLEIANFFNPGCTAKVKKGSRALR